MADPILLPGPEVTVELRITHRVRVPRRERRPMQVALLRAVDDVLMIYSATLLGGSIEDVSPEDELMAQEPKQSRRPLPSWLPIAAVVVAVVLGIIVVWIVS